MATVLPPPRAQERQQYRGASTARLPVAIDPISSSSSSNWRFSSSHRSLRIGLYLVQSLWLVKHSKGSDFAAQHVVVSGWEHVNLPAQCSAGARTLVDAKAHEFKRFGDHGGVVL